MDFEEIYERGNRRMYQWEIEILYETASSIKAKSILEIGAWDGCSTMVLGAVAKENNGRLYSIDPRLTITMLKNIEEMKLRNYVTNIVGASPWIDMKCMPNSYDYIFIDGDHRTRWVLADYHFWMRFLRKHGMVAFHDIHFPSIQKALEIIKETDEKGLKEVRYTEKKKRGILVWQT